MVFYGDSFSFDPNLFMKLQNSIKMEYKQEYEKEV